VHYRILGATLTGLAFVLPSFFMVVALGWVYSLYGGLSWMQAVFYGVGAAVIGIIVISAHKLTTKSIGKDKLLWAIFLILAAVTVITESEIAWLFIAAGIMTWLWRAPPRRWGGGGMAAALPVDMVHTGSFMASLDWPLLTQIGVFFAKLVPLCSAPVWPLFPFSMGVWLPNTIGLTRSSLSTRWPWP